MYTVEIISVAIPLLLTIGGVGIHNRLVILRNRLKNAYSQITVQLKRRNDLIPNLVGCAKKYLDHEKEVLDSVLDAINDANLAQEEAGDTPGSKVAMLSLLSAEAGLSQAMGKLLAIVDKCSDLKADETMTDLMKEITSTENRIGFARQAYNDSVMRYNNARETLPNSILAELTGFEAAELWDVSASAPDYTPYNTI